MEEIWELAYRGEKEPQAEHRKLAELLPSGDEKLKKVEDAVERETASTNIYIDTKFG
jgi:hypothetical protein